MGKYLPYDFCEKMAATTAVLLLVLLLSTGCAKFQPRPIAPAETATAFESRTLDNPELKDFLEKNLSPEMVPRHPHAWNFVSLTLVAFYYHPDLAVARANREVMEAAIIKAGARSNPKVTASAGFISNPDSGVSPWLFGLAPDIPFETAGKRSYRVARATHLAAAAYWNVATAAWQVRSRLRTSLLKLYAAMEKEALLNRELALQTQFVELLVQRFDYGQISRPVLTRAQISLDQIRLAQHEIQKEIAENRVMLAEALGLPSGALEGIAISYDYLKQFPDKLPSPDLRRQALFNRPDILAALSEYNAAQSTLQLEIAKQYPDIHLGPAYHFDDGENKWTLGFSIDLPVLNRNQGPIAEAEARRVELAARFVALQARVIGEIDQALAGYEMDLRTLKVAKNIFNVQKNQEQSVQARLDSGEDDRLALLSAQLRLSATALSRLKSLYNAQQALGLLEDALHQALIPPGLPPVVPETVTGAEK
jgi:cobalt-zinc-cadmium efflux system outer membrane protein